MADTEVGKLLITVGGELGRSPQQMEAIIKKLVEEEWYDSLDSLRQLTDEQWAKLALPARLTEKLRAALESSPPSLVPIPPPPIKTKVEVAPADFAASAAAVPVGVLLESLRAEIEAVAAHADDGETYLGECLRTLSVIARNVLVDPQNPKFRQLKATNPKFQLHVGRWQCAVAILGTLGFVLTNDVYECNTVYVSRFTDVSDAIQNELRAVAPDLAEPLPTATAAFNPFKASFTNAGDTFGAPKGRVLEEREAELEELRKQAIQPQVAAKGVALERPRLVSLSAVKNNSHAAADDGDDDTSLLLASMRSIAAAGESAQKFRSRERIELEKLRARPVFSSCKVRVLFADKKALEIVVGTGETVQGLYKIVSSCLRNDVKSSTSWILTISPPLRKLDRASTRTMVEEEFVPSVTVRMTVNGNQCNSYDVLVPDLIV